MAALVDHFVLSYRLGFKKPSPELFRRALELSGAPPERCWMVGDSYELDIEPAKASGMHTIWVVRAPEKEKTLLARVMRGEKPRPDWSVVHLEEILEFFCGPRGHADLQSLG
jgi:FMN phosphatase YigB (HAD superfamily)